MNKKKDSTINTIIGEDTAITGNIQLDGNIIIYGKIEGDIKTTGTITVSMTSKLQGNLYGEDVSVSGNVTGNIKASGKVVLGEKAVLKGDIEAAQIVIEDGAKFEGHCFMQLSEGNPAT